MDFELAYDLKVEEGHEVVFVQTADRHRKVRMQLVRVTRSGDERIALMGHSLGSSVRHIKAAKKDEPPIVVNGELERVDGIWRATLSIA